MARFNVDFSKPNEEVIQQIDFVLVEANKELPRTYGCLHNDYEKIIETLPKVKELLEKGERIPALDEAYKLTQSFTYQS